MIETVESLRKTLDAARAGGRAVGLVPTMGYLHAGHTSLMARAAGDCDVVAATIFVNPLQFGPDEDLARYPRDLERDQKVAAEAGVDVLFVPSEKEMFPGPVLTRVSVAAAGEAMEGVSRPGHLDGVATVVAKLFAIAGACRAYFGEKDYQQLMVVRQVVADLSFPVKIVACPTVREPDGLAMSSRNAYLSAEERRAATVLYRALTAGKAAFDSGEHDSQAIGRIMAGVVETEPLARLDYAEAHPAHRVNRLFVAARLGGTRLIDNLAVS